MEDSARINALLDKVGLIPHLLFDNQHEILASLYEVQAKLTQRPLYVIDLLKVVDLLNKAQTANSESCSAFTEWERRNAGNIGENVMEVTISWLGAKEAFGKAQLALLSIRSILNKLNYATVELQG